jgi:hypothetical protein
MRTARAIELGLCLGLLVGTALGFAAGVGLVVKKPARFGLSEVVSMNDTTDTPHTGEHVGSMNRMAVLKESR